MVEITWDLARAAAEDAANRQMKKDGRGVWNENDYQLAGEVFNRLMSPHKRIKEERKFYADTTSTTWTRATR